MTLSIDDIKFYTVVADYPIKKKLLKQYMNLGKLVYAVVFIDEVPADPDARVIGMFYSAGIRRYMWRGLIFGSVGEAPYNGLGQPILNTWYHHVKEANPHSKLYLEYLYQINKSRL